MSKNSKDGLNNIYEAAVFGKPSIPLSAEEQEAKRSRKDILTERDTVINTYLPQRMHVKKGNHDQQQNQPQSRGRSSGSLKEKYESKKVPNVESAFLNLLESYFLTERHLELDSVDQVMEDMYSFLKENQQ